MQNTIQISIAVDDTLIREELIARLSAIDFDAFEEKDNELDAFTDEGKFDAVTLQNILDQYELHFTKTIIEKQNWNAIWESNFEPVVVEDFCVIRAEFHASPSKTSHEIIITPKMSFGTGHHATTYLMINEMRHLDFKEKQVADFGTGTGVLAILAEKLGSKCVWAIDIDDWSIENSKENIEKNGCKNIRVEKADGFNPTQQFDVVLANINKNIIMQNVVNLASGLNEHGKLLLSGLLKDDESVIVTAFKEKGLDHILTRSRDNWICILLVKKEV